MRFSFDKVKIRFNKIRFNNKAKLNLNLNKNALLHRHNIENHRCIKNHAYC